MMIYQGDVATWVPRPDRSAVAIGVFDGVHRGHQRVLHALRTPDHDVVRVALTFGTHPAAVLAPGTAPTRLSTLKRRFDLFAAAGIERVAVLSFDESLRGLTPEVFVETFLVNGLNARFVAVGEGFRFGRDAAGTTQTLRALGTLHGFEVDVVEIAKHGGVEIRSSLIRRRIEEGDVADASAMLGRPYEIEGIVVPGDARGRRLGVPTANVSMPATLTVPLLGVYAVTVGIDGHTHPGVANLGIRPTFDGTERVLEVHVLGFDQNLYGKHLRVGFVERIRDELRFASIDDLTTQIRSDIATAAVILNDRTS